MGADDSTLQMGPWDDVPEHAAGTSAGSGASSAASVQHLPSRLLTTFKQLQHDIDEAGPHVLAAMSAADDTGVPIQTTSAALVSPHRHPLVNLERCIRADRAAASGQHVGRAAGFQPQQLVFQSGTEATPATNDNPQ